MQTYKSGIGEVTATSIRDHIDEKLNCNETAELKTKSSVESQNLNGKTNKQVIPISEPVSARTLKDLDQFRVTKEKHVPNTPATITIGGVKVAAPQNLTPITAESKAGKTAVAGVILAGAISPDGKIDGFLDIEVMPNPECRAVIHFDTEQSEDDQQYNLKTVLKRANIESTPDYYRSYNIRTLGMKDYKVFTNDLCRLCNDKFHGIHLIVIDGGADYITSVNDEPEANALITYFINLAVIYNCPVILIVHLNENAGKNGDTMPRGHLGRQAVRKGYCQLNITKDGDLSTLQVLRARKAGSIDSPLVIYQFSKEKGYHESVDAKSITMFIKIEKDLASRKKAELIAAKVFSPPTSLSHKDSIAKIQKVTGKSFETGRRYLRDMLAWEIVEKNEDGCYRSVAKEITEKGIVH